MTTTWGQNHCIIASPAGYDEYFRRCWGFVTLRFAFGGTRVNGAWSEINKARLWRRCAVRAHKSGRDNNLNAKKRHTARVITPRVGHRLAALHEHEMCVKSRQGRSSTPKLQLLRLRYWDFHLPLFSMHSSRQRHLSAWLNVRTLQILMKIHEGFVLQFNMQPSIRYYYERYIFFFLFFSLWYSWGFCLSSALTGAAYPKCLKMLEIH